MLVSPLASVRPDSAQPPATAPHSPPTRMQEVDVGKHNWANYFLAAYKGVFEHLRANGLAVPPPLGLQVMVHGIVPTGARRLGLCLGRGAAGLALF